MLPTLVSIPIVILSFYIVVVLSGIIIAFIELKNHRASWNSLKILFYCLIILQSLCRAIMIGWGLLKNIEGGEFYSNFPALLFISFSGILGLQMYQFSLKDQDYHLLDSSVSKKKNNRLLKIGTNTLIAFNTIMYACNFLLFGIAERENGNSTTIHNHQTSNPSIPTSSSSSDSSSSSSSSSPSSSSNSDSSIFNDIKSNTNSNIYLIIQIFYIACLGFLLGYHGVVGWKSFKRFKIYFGTKLNIIQLFFMICILIRMTLLIFDPSSKKSSILHFEMSSKSIFIYTIFYFIFGEILPSILALYIQYILPYHTISKGGFLDIDYDDDELKDHYNSNNGNNNNGGKNSWEQDIIIQDRIGIGASGAEVYLCNLKGATFAVKIMKDAVSLDRENFEKEIEIYKTLPKSSNLLEYKGSSKSNQQLKLYMEYMPFTLAKYIDIRQKCGGDSQDDSKKIFKNYLLYQNRGTKQKSKPFYFQYEQSVGILYLISIAVELLHKHNIAHGDLKSDNIFLLLKDTEIHQIKLGDFNMSIRNPDSSYIKKEIYSFALIIYDILNLSNKSCLKEIEPPNIKYQDQCIHSSSSSTSSSSSSSSSLSSSYQHNNNNNNSSSGIGYYNNDIRYNSLIELYENCINGGVYKSMTDIKCFLSDLHKSIIESKGILKF